MKLKLALAALALAFTVACDANTESAERSETVELTGTVENIDQAAKQFTVKGGGKLTTLKVSDAVENFDQLAVGDVIKLYYTEAVAVSMAEAPSGGATLESMTATAEEGDKPGGAAADMLKTTVEFVSYNANNNVATVLTQTGDLLEVNVQPEMQAFAAAREPGDIIAVEILQAVAVVVEPAA